MGPSVDTGAVVSDALARLDHLLVSGGDERQVLDAAGYNRFHVRPRTEGVVLRRGSCTGSSLTPLATRSLSSALADASTTWPSSESYEELRRELATLLALDDDVAIVFAPCGTDVCYVPLLIESLIEPERPVLNLVTRTDEIGRGCIAAHAGKHHSSRTQLGTAQVGSPVAPRLHVEVCPISAREPDGQPRDPWPTILQTIHTSGPGHRVLVSLVDCSKSGLRDSLDEVGNLIECDAVWSLDACQLRLTTESINDALRRGGYVFITGSKFFEAPPFCGACLVPEWAHERLRDARTRPEAIEGFRSIFSMFDLPETFGPRRLFRRTVNEGLLVRWRAAILEFEALATWKQSEVDDAIAGWHRAVSGALLDHGFRLLPTTDRSSRSIVSFTTERADGVLTLQHAQSLHRVVNRSSNLMGGVDAVQIGQPLVSNGEAVLRLALGSSGLRSLLASGGRHDADLALVEMLSKLIDQVSQNRSHDPSGAIGLPLD